MDDAKNVKSNVKNTYTVGKDMPLWFKEKLKHGKAKLNKNEDNELESVTIFSATKNYIAYPGDTVMLNVRGMSVIKKEDTKEDKKDVQK